MPALPACCLPATRAAAVRAGRSRRAPEQTGKGVRICPSLRNPAGVCASLGWGWGRVAGKRVQIWDLVHVVVEEGSWSRHRREVLLGDAAGVSSKLAAVPTGCPRLHVTPTRVLSLLLLPLLFSDSGAELLGRQTEECVPTCAEWMGGR